MQRWATTGLGLTLGLLTVCAAIKGADAPVVTVPTPDELGQAAALVKKLGDPSYEARRDADKELQQMGRAAKKVLRDNLANGDPEVVRRCERLLTLATRTETELALDAFLQNKDDKLLLKLPTWGRFSEMAGKDEAARMLFVEMYSSEGALLEALDKDPKAFGPVFNTRCTQLQQILWTPWGTQGNIGLGQVVALLFAASDPRMTFDINSFYQMTNFLYPNNIQQAFKADAGSRRILTTFIEKRCDQNTLPQIMPLILTMEIKELVPVALKMAIAKETQAYNKSTAMLIVGKMGTKEDAAKLEPMLTDTTNLGAVMQGTVRLDAQLRDVALAAVIEANGQSPTDYGFPYLQANPNVAARGGYVAPSWYGFAKDADRTEALKKFRDWQGKQAKK